MSIHKKITQVSDLLDLKQDFTICYGHFNLIHPGHIRYLQYAKDLGGSLIVVIKSDKILDAQSFGDHYNETERAHGIANIQVVDYVVILKEDTLDGMINQIRPVNLVLGREFKHSQPPEVKAAIKTLLGIKDSSIIFHAGETHYASSDLLHSNVSDMDDAKKLKLREICNHFGITANTLIETISNFQSSNMLVIGDTIIDNYVACDAIGMSAEAPVLVVKELDNKEFVGGAAIVASHVKALGGCCSYISVAGDDPQLDTVKEVLKSRDIDTHIFKDHTRPTTYKTRYMVENQKLFRVSRIREHKISEQIETDIINTIEKLAPKLSGIMISDFVYGVITPRILNAVVNLSETYDIKLFGDLQCSSQVGDVAKFHGFDLITPTEKESRIALNDSESGIEWISNTLLSKTQSKNMLVKLGSDGFIAYGNEEKPHRQNFPALTSNPVDVSGAGDSLFAAMSVSLSSGADVIQSSAIGACMASLAVRKVGNIPIEKSELSHYIADILR